MELNQQNNPPPEINRTLLKAEEAQHCSVAKSTASEIRTDWINVGRFLGTHPQGFNSELEEIVAACNVSKGVAFAMREAWMSIQVVPEPAPQPEEK